MEKGEITAGLADFIERQEISGIPADVLQKANLLITDFLGVTVGGSKEESARIAQDMIRQQSVGGGATIIGTDMESHPAWSALANGISGHVLDFDDVSQPMYGHPTVAVLPACLAVSEWLGASGKAALEAYIIGLEVAVKLGYVLNPVHYEKGWHATCTLGTMGATVAAAKLLGLSAEKLRSALALAASQACGLQRNFGTMTKSFHAGRASENGVIAALLASKGWTGDQAIMDGPRGFLGIFGACSVEGEETAMFSGKLGNPFDIEDPGIILKKYPSCAFTHPGIDAALEITQRPQYDARKIERVEAYLHDLADQILNHREPVTGLEAKFSIEGCLALALLDGHVSGKSFHDKKVKTDSIQSMIARVERKVDNCGDSTEPKGFGPTTVKVYLGGGSVLEARVEKARGSPENPLTPTEVREKYIDCCTGILPEKAIEASLSLLNNMEDLDDIRKLMQCFQVKSEPH
ncbi:MAG: MmgE/PrpD family protein [Desulfobacteraceae bacterium]|nr:MmgE/PrpD family protein [Desulfobacteraceae bacterium]